jgi:hypothetical protein
MVKTQQVEVLDAKDTLVLHAKRAQYDRSEDRLIKNTAPIEIDEEITLNGRGYLLNAVAMHRGQTPARGHWFAYRRTWSTTEPTVANWWQCDNTAVMQVPPEDVLKQTEKAALFLYRRRPRRVFCLWNSRPFWSVEEATL